MKRYLTTLFVALVSGMLNETKAQNGMQPNDTVKLQVINEKENETNRVHLNPTDDRLKVEFFGDSVYNIFTADSIVSIEPTTPHGTKLVVRGANQDKAGISCWYKNDPSAAVNIDPENSHTLRADNSMNRTTFLKLSSKTHPNGIELEFAQNGGKGVKARLWRVKPWTNSDNPLQIKICLIRDNRIIDSCFVDSAFTLTAIDTLKSICFAWKASNNIFSPSLKINNNYCALELQGNQYTIKENLDSLLRDKGIYEILFEYQMFVNDDNGSKLVTNKVKYIIERKARNNVTFLKKLLHFARLYCPWLLLGILILFVILWLHGKKIKCNLWSLNKHDNSTVSSKDGNGKDGSDHINPNVTPCDPHAEESEAIGSDSPKTAFCFEVNMKKEELLEQLKTLIDETTKHEEVQKDNIFSALLKKLFFKKYAQDQRKRQERSKELALQLEVLHTALKNGMVDIADFQKLKKECDELKVNNDKFERSRDVARRAAESLYTEQLLYVLKNLYVNYVNKTTINERLNTMIALFDKEIDSSNPTELADRFKQKHINALLAAIELCFVSTNRKVEWCNKFNIIYRQDDDVIDTLVEDIYNKGYKEGYAAVPAPDYSEIDRLNKKVDELNKAKVALSEENSQLHSSNDRLEKQAKDLKDQLHNVQTELKNRPVIEVPVLPEDIKKEIEVLNEGHQKEVDSLSETINDLNSTIAQLKEKHQEELDTIGAKHKEDVDNLNKAHAAQLTKIKAEYKKEIEALNEGHQKEVDSLSETINDLNSTIAQLKEKHQEELDTIGAKHKEDVDNLNKAHAAQLTKIKAEYKKEIEALNEGHQKEVDSLSETINDLNSTIAQLKEKHQEELDAIGAKHKKEIGSLNKVHDEKMKDLIAKPNGWCNDFIAEVRQQIDALGVELHNLQASVEGGANTDRPIFVNAITEMTQFFDVFGNNVKKVFDENCSQDDLDLPAIRESLLTMFSKVLNYSGSWANRLLLLESYSRVPQLADQMQSRGVDVATIERAAAIAKALFAKTGFSIVEPAVLAAPYKSDCYDFENNEVLIYRFFPEVSPQDYSGRIFDLVRVGYNVVGGEHKNPVVVYF